jgi:hypothetical protein
VRGPAHALRAGRIAEQVSDRRPEGGEIARVIEQYSALAVRDLILDPAGLGRHHRARLPHRLGHGQPEPLGDALLRDHPCVTLKRVDDDCVLVGIVHPDRREVDAGTELLWQALPRGDRAAQDLLALGVVGDSFHCWAGVEEVRARGVGDVLGEALDHAQRILEGVPARDLEDERVVPAERLVLHQLDLALHATLGPVVTLERDGSALGALDQPNSPKDRLDALGLELLVLRCEDIDGRLDQEDAVAVEPLPDERVV